jgi:hypothetical protein
LLKDSFAAYEDAVLLKLVSGITERIKAEGVDLDA